VTYSVSDGERLAAWASLADEGVGVSDVIRLKGRPLLVGSVGSDEAGRGDLRIRDPLTGKALQRADVDGLPAYRLALSGDGRRLAVMSKTHVVFYRISE
jgi:hypothetical protein